MRSLYAELSDKIGRAAGPAAARGPRQDLGIMLFSRRDAIAALWEAADRTATNDARLGPEDLRSAVEALRPLFGER